MRKEEDKLRNLVDIMQHLITLHKELIQLSRSKTEEIKQGDLDSLSKLLIQERKQVQVITQKESERQTYVDAFFKEKQAEDEEKTMTNLLSHLNNEEDIEKLEQMMSELIDLIVELRDVEKLNQDLMAQSMQFVQLSLDMLQPSLKRMNYDDKKTPQTETNQSVFDSRA